MEQVLAASNYYEVYDVDSPSPSASSHSPPSCLLPHSPKSTTEQRQQLRPASLSQSHNSHRVSKAPLDPSTPVIPSRDLLQADDSSLSAASKDNKVEIYATNFLFALTATTQEKDFIFSMAMTAENGDSQRPLPRNSGNSLGDKRHPIVLEDDAPNEGPSSPACKAFNTERVYQDQRYNGREDFMESVLPLSPVGLNNLVENLLKEEAEARADDQLPRSKRPRRSHDRKLPPKEVSFSLPAVTGDLEFDLGIQEDEALAWSCV
ncbi:hypothetical protein PV11_08556 [Exophiala sideris]|uniref:Uncharacterized protein n=1 Tax=Exophiala sideris TaxID=1016849 RepID=A0A0D1YJD8_9EURO|nr:hypothetical protein PV11_08556 [Exophiala sideris]